MMKKSKTRKQKLIEYISKRTNEFPYWQLCKCKYLDLCEIVEFDLKEDIFKVLDSLNIKY